MEGVQAIEGSVGSADPEVFRIFSCFPAGIFFPLRHPFTGICDLPQNHLFRIKFVSIADQPFEFRLHNQAGQWENSLSTGISASASSRSSFARCSSSLRVRASSTEKRPTRVRFRLFIAPPQPSFCPIS